MDTVYCIYLFTWGSRARSAIMNALVKTFLGKLEVPYQLCKRSPSEAVGGES